MGVVAATPRTAAGHVLALGGATVVCAGAAAACGRRVLELVPGVAAARPDELVELGVLATGVVVLAWLAGSAAMAATCLLVRRAGAVWRRGEAWVHRCAPAVVRRALVVAVAAGLGAASVATASAADLSPTPTPSIASVATPGAGPDLGWVVTATSPTPSTSPSPAATAPATSGVVPTSAAGPRERMGIHPRTAPADGASAGTDGAASTPTAELPSATSSAPAPCAAPPGTTSAATAASAVATAPFDPSWAPSVGSARSGSAARPGDSLGASGTLVAGAWRPTGSPAGDALAIPRGARWTSTGASAGGQAATVVVLRGDTLWGIAARHLPADASAADVAAAWPAWYAANAATIGPDPGLILPGQVLVVPAAVTR